MTRAGWIGVLVGVVLFAVGLGLAATPVSARNLECGTVLAPDDSGGVSEAFGSFTNKACTDAIDDRRLLAIGAGGAGLLIVLASSFRAATRGLGRGLRYGNGRDGDAELGIGGFDEL